MRARSRVLHQGPAKYFLIIRSEMKRNVSASPILGCAERVLLCFRFQLKPYLVSLELEKYGWVVSSLSHGLNSRVAVAIIICKLFFYIIYKIKVLTNKGIDDIMA